MIKEEIQHHYSNFIDNYFQRLETSNEEFEKILIKLEQLEQTVSNKSEEKMSFVCNLQAFMSEGEIPPGHRGKIWLYLSGTHDIIRACGGIYEKVVEDHANQHSEATAQIAKDLERTFPGSSGGFTRSSLQRVLEAYSRKNPTVGYCQGMNFIAAGLLVFMNEEEAFWMMSWIVEHLLQQYYSHHLAGPQADAAILEHYLRKRIPSLYKHFKKIGLQISVLCTQWFMCLFITSVPCETAFRIWDKIFLNGTFGPKVIFETALRLLKFYEKRLKTLNDVSDVAVFLSTEMSKLLDLGPINDINLKPLEAKKILDLRREKIAEIEEQNRK